MFYEPKSVMVPPSIAPKAGFLSNDLNVTFFNFFVPFSFFSFLPFSFYRNKFILR